MFEFRQFMLHLLFHFSRRILPLLPLARLNSLLEPLAPAPFHLVLAHKEWGT